MIEEILKDNQLYTESRGALGKRANFRSFNFAGANFEGASLVGVNFNCANLRGVNFAGADLRGVNLRGANLEGAYFAGANLAGANLSNAKMAFINLAFANLADANLEGANLERANLAGAKLWNATGDGQTIRSEQIGIYRLVYTRQKVWIGCQGHTISEWESFDDDTISEMEPGSSLDWWRENKKLAIDTVRNTKWY